ncbi:unnamed protein product [Prorocentrum cordatum]|uniref:Biogenesis of lysosome-related organelles complex 1 subunit 7 n=1 Tax=Prorocentrum cordatum TaxID=2364126 RepID=A0ABN9VAR4_9DINO|nr:unnamed protein product [Polarella glacialis]
MRGGGAAGAARGEAARGRAVQSGGGVGGQAGGDADEVGGSLSESSSAGSAAARGTRAAAGRSGTCTKEPRGQGRGGVARGGGREKLSWKATFIDLRDDERQGSLSPRPSSEPCSESSSRCSAYFDADRICTALLSKQMEEAWASNCRETMKKLLSADPKSDSKDETHKEGADGRAVLHVGDACSSLAQASTTVTYQSRAKGRTGASTDAIGSGLSESSSTGSVSASTAMRGSVCAKSPWRQRPGSVAKMEGREKLSWKATFIDLCADERQGSLSPRPSSEPCSESPSSSAFFDADRINTAALSKHMEAAWASNSRETMRTSLEKRRLSAAAAAIDSIPEQLSSVVHNKAQSLAESVKTDLSLVQKAIRSSGGDDDAVDVAIDQLDRIPGIIRSSFDSKIMEANGAIRMKLSAIIQRFKAMLPRARKW